MSDQPPASPAADFSHLREQYYQPELIVRLEEKNEKVTDDTLLEILNRVSPPLLELKEMKTVVALLERRRGRRPSRGVPSLTWLSRKIARLERPDVHARFLLALAARLVSEKGHRDFEDEWASYKRRRTPKRDGLIRHLFYEFYQLIADAPSSVQHEILGEVRVPLDLETRESRAAEMTHQVMRDRLGERPPSHSTILKIVRTRRHYIKPF